MNITYFIQLFDDDLADCQWLRFNERTPVGAAQPGELDSVLAEAVGHDLVVIAPASSVVLHKVSLVAKSRSQISAALPFALEEELAADVDDMHFAHRTIDKQSGEQLVAVIEKAFINRLFKRLTAHKFTSILVQPQLLSIPWQQDGWSLFAQRDYAILRKNASDAYAMDALVMDELIAAEAEHYKAQNIEAPDVTLYNFAAEEGDSGDHLLGGDSEAMAVMARHLQDHPDDRLDLLQGNFQISKPIGDVLRQWSMVAGLAALALVFYLVSIGIDNYRLANERDRLQASMDTLYEQIFSEPSKGDPVQEMRRKLIALGGNQEGADNFISVMLASGKEFVADSKSKISRLRYTGKAIEVDLETSSIEQLEKLQQKITEGSTNVQLKAVTNDNGKIRGRLVVTANGKQS